MFLLMDVCFLSVDDSPANSTSHNSNVLMLGHRPRRWPNIKPSLLQCIVSTPLCLSLSSFFPPVLQSPCWILCHDLVIYLAMLSADGSTNDKRSWGMFIEDNAIERHCWRGHNKLSPCLIGEHPHILSNHGAFSYLRYTIIENITHCRWEVGLMLSQRRRRWPSVKPTLDQCIFAPQRGRYFKFLTILRPWHWTNTNLMPHHRLRRWQNIKPASVQRPVH